MSQIKRPERCGDAGRGVNRRGPCGGARTLAIIPCSAGQCTHGARLAVYLLYRRCLDRKWTCDFHIYHVSYFTYPSHGRQQVFTDVYRVIMTYFLQVKKPTNFKQPPDFKPRNLRLYHDGKGSDLHLQQRNARFCDWCIWLPNFCAYGRLQWHRRWHDQRMYSLRQVVFKFTYD